MPCILLSCHAHKPRKVARRLSGRARCPTPKSTCCQQDRRRCHTLYVLGLSGLCSDACQTHQLKNPGTLALQGPRRWDVWPPRQIKTGCNLCGGASLAHSHAFHHTAGIAIGNSTSISVHSRLFSSDFTHRYATGLNHLNTRCPYGIADLCCAANVRTGGTHEHDVCSTPGVRHREQSEWPAAAVFQQAAARPAKRPTITELRIWSPGAYAAPCVMGLFSFCVENCTTQNTQKYGVQSLHGLNVPL